MAAWIVWVSFLTVVVRREVDGDAEAVRQVHLAAFGDHGGVVDDLVDELRSILSPSRGAALVAEEEDEIVGQVMFTASLLDSDRRLVEVQVLSPLGVRSDRQGRGIGQSLVGAGLQMMVDQSVPVVFLEGDPAYYSRFGFRPGGQQGFRKPALRIPDAAFQALRLPAHEGWMTGTLVYSEIFWRLDCVGLRDEEARLGHLPPN